MDIDYVVIPTILAIALTLAVTWAVRRASLLGRGDHLLARNWIERGILWFVALAGTGIGVSAAVNAIALYWYRHPPPGAMYRVSGHFMRMQCMGEGLPTLVLEAGARNDGLNWTGIQPKLALHTRVCSYDRSGLGWSDRLPRPRDADHIAIELHELLVSASVARPAILMGHSMGGLLIRDYTAHYPSDVAGLVFEDSSTPLQNRNPAYLAFDGPRKETRFSSFLNEAMFVLGVPRLFGACSGRLDREHPLGGRVVYEDKCHQAFGAIEAEAEDFDLSGRETINTGPFGDLPILILTHDHGLDSADGLPGTLIQASKANQAGLLNLSERSRQVVAKGSGHFIHLDRPELVEREVIDFIDRVRGSKPDLQPRHSVTQE